jgi:signal transduction histidine kinase
VTTAESRPPESLRSVRGDFWARTLRGWDIAFYLMVAIGAVAVALDSSRTSDLVIVLVTLALLVVAYVAIGRRAARTARWDLALAYLLVLIVAVTVVVRFSAVGSILLFIAYSQVWFFADRRRTGVVLSTVLTIGVVAATVGRYGLRSDALPEVAAQSAIGLAFALLLGLWITQVAEQSEERGALLAQLQAAQAEIARSHHDAGVAQERQRMAQEIHDTLAQGLTSIVMLAQSASQDLRRGEVDSAGQRMALVERTARDNLSEARALVAAFAPVGLDGSTLGEALERLGRRFEEETGVRVRVVVPDGSGPGVVDREREVIVLRAAQEALANVRRHAGAGRVELVLGVGPGSADEPDGSLRLEVVDDGRGIDAAAVEGFGLRGMRERVTSGGGRLEVSGVGTGGTRVRVTLPAAQEGPT